MTDHAAVDAPADRSVDAPARRSTNTTGTIGTTNITNITNTTDTTRHRTAPTTRGPVHRGPASRRPGEAGRGARDSRGPQDTRGTRVPRPRSGYESVADRHRRTLPRYQFAERLLAVLSGQRPVHSMISVTAPDAYDELVRLAPRSPLRGRGTRPVIRRCDERSPRAGVIEAWARIAAGDQLRAMAFRLEQGPDLRWKCAAIEVGAPA